MGDTLAVKPNTAKGRHFSDWLAILGLTCAACSTASPHLDYLINRRGEHSSFAALTSQWVVTDQLDDPLVQNYNLAGGVSLLPKEYLHITPYLTNLNLGLGAGLMLPGHAALHGYSTFGVTGLSGGAQLAANLWEWSVVTAEYGPTQLIGVSSGGASCMLCVGGPHIRARYGLHGHVSLRAMEELDLRGSVLNLDTRFPGFGLSAALYER